MTGAPEQPALSGEEMRQRLEPLSDVRVGVTAILGRASLPIAQFLKLTRGSIVELRRKKDENLELEASGHVFAQGGVTIIDGKVGIEVKQA